MNTRSSLFSGFWLFLLMAGFSMAALPDFEKEYKGKGLFSINEISGTQIIKIATDDPFDLVQFRLEKLLGKEWVEVPLQKVNQRKKGVFPQGKEGQAPKKLGMVRYENPKNKGVFVHLVLMELPLKEKSYTAVITVLKKR